MTVEQMRRKRQQFGYSCEQLSELSGVSLETVQKIFHDNEEVFSQDILKQIESVFENKRDSDRGFSYVCESKMEYGISKKSRECTLEDYYQLPDERRAELIDGVIYDMSAPTIIHQKISLEISVRFHAFISQKKGACMVFSAPVDVQLDCDNKTMVEPDVGIICDTSKIKRFGIYGAPDFVLEVISPSTKKRDYALKLSKYMEAGVREYWIVDFVQAKILVYYFEGDNYPVIYGFDKPVPVNIYDDNLKIDFTNIAKWLKDGME
mgnify:CR=1 FL=1